jgi:hypothetical protein
LVPGIELAISAGVGLMALADVAGASRTRGGIFRKIRNGAARGTGWCVLHPGATPMRADSDGADRGSHEDGDSADAFLRDWTAGTRWAALGRKRALDDFCPATAIAAKLKSFECWFKLSQTILILKRLALISRLTCMQNHATTWTVSGTGPPLGSIRPAGKRCQRPAYGRSIVLSDSPERAGVAPDLLAQLNPSTLEDVLSLARQDRYEAEEIQFKQGDQRDGIFLIKFGQVKSSYVSEDGRELTLGRRGNTWPQRCAAVSAMRRVVHEGHTPKPLQEKATNSRARIHRNARGQNSVRLSASAPTALAKPRSGE